VKRFQQLRNGANGGQISQPAHALRAELEAAEQKIKTLTDENNKLAVRVQEMKQELEKMEKKYRKAMNIAERALAELKGRR
jgi:predicted RNase H-like nuclease (RuvC/YqgF family)